MSRFIDTACESKYRFGYKVSNLDAKEIGDDIYVATCELKIKNQYGTWGIYKLHVIANYNNYDVTWDVY